MVVMTKPRGGGTGFSSVNQGKRRDPDYGHATADAQSETAIESDGAHFTGSQLISSE